MPDRSNDHPTGFRPVDQQPGTKAITPSRDQAVVQNVIDVSQEYVPAKAKRRRPKPAEDE